MNNITQHFTRLMKKSSIKDNNNNKLKNNNHVKSFFYKIYNEIDNSYKHINNLNMLKDINDNITSIDSDLLTYIDINIQNHINDSILSDGGGVIQIRTKIMDTIIHLNIYIYKDDFNHLNLFDKYIKHTMAWFHFILKYITNDKQIITLNIIPTLLKKTLPKNDIDVLSSINCNTGITTACNKNGEILIYRDEEWFKVLIHETFHLLCLDFSGISYDNLKVMMYDLFPISSDLLISETYSEFFASILNTCFFIFNMDNQLDINKFMINLNVLYFYEKMFALYQLNKILKFMGLRYLDLIKKNNIFKEKTNVFAYYILKAILLYFRNDFLVWCINNNNSDNIFKFINNNNSFNNLIKFINNKMLNKRFIKDLNHIFKLNLDTSVDYELSNTLRMTLFSNDVKVI